MRYLIPIALTVILSATLTHADTNVDSRTANSAASVSAADCIEGSSAQGKSIGFSFGGESAQCKALRQAAAHVEAYNSVEDKASIEAQYHKSRADHFRGLAAEAVESTHVTDVISENTNNLLLPLSFILGLIILL